MLGNIVLDGNGFLGYINLGAIAVLIEFSYHIGKSRLYFFLTRNRIYDHKSLFHSCASLFEKIQPQ